MPLRGHLLPHFNPFLANFRGEDPQVVIELALRALDLVPDDSLLFRSALAWNLGDDLLDVG